MQVRILESARDDLRAGWSFYEQRSPGLGEYFLDCLGADVRSLQFYAGIHETADGFHRLLATRFPFAVYYLVEGKRVDVYAILDCRRDPDWIAVRLGSSRQKPY